MPSGQSSFDYESSFAWTASHLDVLFQAHSQTNDWEKSLLERQTSKTNELLILYGCTFEDSQMNSRIRVTEEGNADWSTDCLRKKGVPSHSEAGLEAQQVLRALSGWVYFW